MIQLQLYYVNYNILKIKFYVHLSKNKINNIRTYYNLLNVFHVNILML